MSHRPGNRMPSSRVPVRLLSYNRPRLRLPNRSPPVPYFHPVYLPPASQHFHPVGRRHPTAQTRRLPIHPRPPLRNQLIRLSSRHPQALRQKSVQSYLFIHSLIILHLRCRDSWLRCRCYWCFRSLRLSHRPRLARNRQRIPLISRLSRHCSHPIRRCTPDRR